MGINIKNAETERLIRELAEIDGRRADRGSHDRRARADRSAEARKRRWPSGFLRLAARPHRFSRTAIWTTRCTARTAFMIARRACRNDRRYVGGRRDLLERARCQRDMPTRSRQATVCRMSAATYLEVAIVVAIAAQTAAAGRRLDDVMRDADIAIEPVTEAPGAHRARGLSRLRQGQRSSGRPQFRRLLRLCAGARQRRAAALQGRRFRPHRHSLGARLTAAAPRPI